MLVLNLLKEQYHKSFAYFLSHKKSKIKFYHLIKNDLLMLFKKFLFLNNLFILIINLVE